MKALLSSFLIGALTVLLSSTTSAQRAPTYTSSAALAPSPYRGGYVARRVWVPGHYETVRQCVFVPGQVQRVWVEPVYEWRIGTCGVRYVCVRAGYWRSIQLPGHYETQRVRVYREGHWSGLGSCD
jgi:hypothetical protein